jgi:hypothetical protein
MRFLFATLAVLVALSVPVAAAAFATAAPPAPVAPAELSKAGTELWITGAPPPLLIMLLGTLVITITIMRHLRTRRSPLTLNATLDGRSSLGSLR